MLEVIDIVKLNFEVMFSLVDYFDVVYLICLFFFLVLGFFEYEGKFFYLKFFIVRIKYNCFLCGIEKILSVGMM